MDVCMEHCDILLSSFLNLNLMTVYESQLDIAALFYQGISVVMDLWCFLVSSAAAVNAICTCHCCRQTHSLTAT